jgi:hypothetical protein
MKPYPLYDCRDGAASAVCFFHMATTVLVWKETDRFMHIVKQSSCMALTTTRQVGTV